MEIELTREEKDFIKKVAKYRTFENEGKHDIAAYNKSKMVFDNLSNNTISVAAEAGVVKACGYDIRKVGLDVWPAFYLDEHKKLYDGADVNHQGKHFEVRRVNKLSNPLAIRKKDLGQGTANVKTYIDYEYSIAEQKFT